MLSELDRVPAGQVSQEAAPVPLLTVPPVHLVHSTAPASLEKVPGGHTSHPAAGAEPYWPVGQGVQEEEPLCENSPAGQLLHSALPGEEA